MKAIKLICVLLQISFLFRLLLAIKIQQVPKALDLSNHFGTEPRKNFYGPNHYINKNSFLNRDESLLSSFNSNNGLKIVSGKINRVLKEAHEIITPFVPVR